MTLLVCCSLKILLSVLSRNSKQFSLQLHVGFDVSYSHTNFGKYITLTLIKRIELISMQNCSRKLAQGNLLSCGNEELIHTQTISHSKMGSARKYPYPTMGDIEILPPPAFGNSKMLHPPHTFGIPDSFTPPSLLEFQRCFQPLQNFLFNLPTPPRNLFFGLLKKCDVY